MTGVIYYAVGHDAVIGSFVTINPGSNINVGPDQMVGPLTVEKNARAAFSTNQVAGIIPGGFC